MTTKKVYIISHSHWDREWYMAYEQHHMRLVALMDDLLHLFKTNPDFHSFHLDGQTIAIDDYLEVRPEKREEVQAAITAGKLKIGPFYILQDDFLISSESNTRNMLVGLEESRKWGDPVMLGYFPDTFGNMGQAPQMMKEGGIEAAAFGRGVKPTGFNNVVINDEKYTSQFSEMWWEGADKSKIFSLLFANWYSNGNEIPVEKEAAQAFWKEKLADAEQFTSTDHILMMNGVDHQPVQMDVTDAIKVANDLYDDYEFIHSSFDEYLEAVMNDVPADLSTVSGELTSQETDGWYTLANTASARIYLKQKNTDVQRQLENITEPLATMAFDVTGEYPHDQLRYAWKLLMQNHPHDSICGCSVDEVHREMITRYDKALEVGKFLASEAVESLTASIDTSLFPTDSKPFVVFNTAGSSKTGTIETEIEWKRLPFSQGVPEELYAQLKNETLPELTVIDAKGQAVAAEILSHEVRFNYDLPKDAFRVPFMAIYVKVRLVVTDMPAVSWESLALTVGQNTASALPTIVSEADDRLENEFLHVKVESNGQLTVTDKTTGITYPNVLTYENVGDIANEYIFKQPEGDQAIYAHDFPATTTVAINTTKIGEITLTQTLMIPVSADETLAEEMKAVVEMRQRKAQRSKELAPFTLTTKIRLEQGSRQLKFSTHFDNQMKDHRLRVLFPTNITTDKHYAESIFEVVERPNGVSASWENPTNPQHQHSFVNVQDATHGMTVSNYGLNEYEILADNTTIALTLHRSVGELGDWGYFPTPEAQCMGEQTVAFALAFHGADDQNRTFHDGQNFQIPFTVAQTSVHNGRWAPKAAYLTIDSSAYALTALKRKEHQTEIVTRGFNLSNTAAAPLEIKISGYTPTRCTLIETPHEKPLSAILEPAEINSLLWTKSASVND
ncbi:alpha-mannosidase [Brochothrix thermosphacta]|uniref:alpha-mannosidase n=1 Tax=Brochothrix thermosphacta TaxID=2756 RepID=UPI000ED5563F|nr:glycoside hydrolase family 38 C-terminal domain-containing protein [Brochothrix thermosphacta]HCZ39938.1 alpha-mannosidase [Brochothrix thermosphacta]HCZ46232.1 alpha-mannosidase [Brochothrix thermosphacta]